MSRVRHAGTRAELVEVVPWIASSYRPSEVVASAATRVREDGRGRVRTLELSTAKCIEAWRRVHRRVPPTRHEAAIEFLQWCLMRCVEVAREVDATTVVVVCDRTTWRRLSGTRHLAGAIYPAIRVERTSD